MALTTRRSRSPVPARCAWWTIPTTRCSSTRSSRAISGGCARRRTRRCRIGSGSRWRGRVRPAGRRCSGWTGSGPTTHSCWRSLNPRAGLLAQTLDRAIGRWLEEDRSPSRKSGELDNRGSHFYLALYWAQELAGQHDDDELASQFESLATRLADAEEQIIDELASVQGSSVDIGGYYLPDRDLMAEAMRP